MVMMKKIDKVLISKMASNFISSCVVDDVD